MKNEVSENLEILHTYTYRNYKVVVSKELGLFDAIVFMIPEMPMFGFWIFQDRFFESLNKAIKASNEWIDEFDDDES